MPPEDQPPRRSPSARKDEIRAQVKATRADIERQFEATKAQIDATSERIQARTGRNLILAILIGLVLGFAMLFSLIVIKELFLLFGAFIVFFTSYELTQALRRSGRMVPVIPAVLATVGMIPLTWFFGGAGQWLGLMGGLVLMIAWRVVETLLPGRHVSGRQLLRDAGASVLVLVYVGLFTSFTVLTIARDGGQWWVLAFLILVIVADTAAYASGLSFGRHPMAPSISPKKTWEGFAGAVLACLVGGVLLAVFMLAGAVVVRPRSGREHPAVRHPRRPLRVVAQARPRHQGHELVAPRPRRFPRQTRLDLAVRRRGVRPLPPVRLIRLAE